jgi:hypothetical protein
VADTQWPAKRKRQRTAIFIAAHKMKNLVAPLWAFLQALEDRTEWDSIIPLYRKDCCRIVEKMEAAVENLINGEPAGQDTAIISEAQEIRRLLEPLRTFFQALESRAQWDSVIPSGQENCSGILKEINSAIDRIVTIEDGETK